ncbi:MAG: hypothetical protein AB1768_00195 [Pseudomonadota bacterium]|jgi:hypothetical protein
MATVNFSVPEEVKKLFNATFKGRNKSAIIAELMRQAAEEERAKAQRTAAAERILRRRAENPPVSLERILAVRDALRRK